MEGYHATSKLSLTARHPARAGPTVAGKFCHVRRNAIIRPAPVAGRQRTAEYLHGLDAALYREKFVQQIGVYQDGDCHNAIRPRALHQIQLDQHPGESESDDPCVKAHAYPTKGLGIQPSNDIGAKWYSNQNAWNKQQ